MTDYSDLIESAGKQYNVDPALIKALVKVESGNNPKAKNAETGAEGLGQFIPKTAQSLGVKDVTDPTQSIPAVARLLSENLDRYGNVHDAVRAYHGGTDKANWGPKTEAHLSKVMGELSPEKNVLDAFLNEGMPLPSSQAAPASDHLNAFLTEGEGETPPVRVELSGMATPAKETATNPVIAGAGDFASALGHHLMAPLHGGANLIEQGLAAGANYLAPNSELAKYLGQTANADVNAARQWEQQYQAQTPTNIPSVAGAVVGDVLPMLAGNVGGAITQGGELGANLAARMGLKQTGQSVGNLLGETAASAGANAAYGLTQPVTDVNNYWKNTLDNLKENLTIGALMPGVSKAISGGASMLGKQASNILGLSTGAGATPIQEAFQAGKTGATDFWKNLTGSADKTEVLDAAKNNLQAMQQNLSKAYRSGMIDVKTDKSVLSFDKIEDALKNVEGNARFKGEIKNEPANHAFEAVNKAISDWKGLPSDEFHTPEGFDALKQKIGGILESIPYEQKSARSVVSQVYNSLKSSIQDQAPTYASVMKNYSEGSDLINEIKRSLSLGEKSSADTGLRKLQSLMRNNANANYGYRLDMAKQLQEEGGKQILPALAGQSLSSMTPRSLAAQGGGLLNLGNLARGIVLSDPTAYASAAALPFQSPALVGAGAYGLGKLGSLGNRITPEQSNVLQLLMLSNAAKQQNQ